MKEGVTKEQFVTALGSVLSLTRTGITGLDLFDDETVIVYYSDGCRRMVNIECDSGIAIIRDVCKGE